MGWTVAKMTDLVCTVFHYCTYSAYTPIKHAGSGWEPPVKESHVPNFDQIREKKLAIWSTVVCTGTRNGHLVPPFTQLVHEFHRQNKLQMCVLKFLHLN